MIDKNVLFFIIYLAAYQITLVFSGSSEDNVLERVKLRGRPRPESLCNFFKDDAELFEKCKSYTLAKISDKRLSVINETVEATTKRSHITLSTTNKKTTQKFSTKTTAASTLSVESTEKENLFTEIPGSTIGQNFTEVSDIAPAAKNSTGNLINIENLAGNATESSEITDNLSSAGGLNDTFGTSPTTADLSTPDNDKITTLSKINETTSPLSFTDNDLTTDSEIITSTPKTTDNEFSTSGIILETTQTGLTDKETTKISSEKLVQEITPTDKDTTLISSDPLVENVTQSTPLDNEISTIGSSQFAKETTLITSTDKETTLTLSDKESSLSSSNLSQETTKSPLTDNTTLTDNDKISQLLSPEEVEKEIDDANLNHTALATFDGKKLKNCSGQVHPVSKITIWMMRKGITKEYFENVCKVNYHDTCQDDWKTCAVKGANIFCPGNCSPLECSKLKTFGYEENGDPSNLHDECEDNPTFKCSYLRERGDCLALAKGIAKICAKTCNYCKNSTEFLPYMPEHMKLTLWLHKYDNGKYSKYAQYVWRKLDETQEKILKNEC